MLAGGRLSGRIARNWAIAFGGTALSSALTLVGLTITARSLGLDEFGAFAVIQSYVRIVEGLASFQTWQGLIRFGSDPKVRDDKARFERLLKFGFCIDVCASVAGFALAVLVGTTYILAFQPNSGVLIPLLAYCFFILFNITGTATAVVRLFDRFVYAAAAQNIGAFVRLIAITGLWYQEHAALASWVFVWVCGEILSCVLLLSFACVELRRRGYTSVWSWPFRAARRDHPDLWGYVWTTSLSGSLRLTTQEADTLIVGGALGSAAAGIYQLGKRYAMLLPRLAEPLQQAVYPEVARLWTQGKREDFRRAIFSTNAVAGGVGCGILGVILFFGPSFVQTVLGSGYDDVALVLAVHAGAFSIFLAGISLRPALLAMGMPREIFKTYLLCTAAFYASILWLLELFGPVGASMAHVLFNGLWFSRMMAMFLFRSSPPNNAGATY